MFCGVIVADTSVASVPLDRSSLFLFVLSRWGPENMQLWVRLVEIFHSLATRKSVSLGSVPTRVQIQAVPLSREPLSLSFPPYKMGQ